MKIIPQSEVKLYRGIETRRLLAFSSVENRDAYFAVHLYRSFSDFTNVKHAVSKIRLEISGTEANVCNYISFKNPAFDNKIFYARIVDYEYINNECTEITFAINDWYTWCFDVTAGDMHIDREHLSVAEYDRSLENPFDPSIVDFQTDEPLPAPRAYEKKMYDVNNVCDNTTVMDDVLLLKDANNVLSVAFDGRDTFGFENMMNNYNVICFSDFNTIDDPYDFYPTVAYDKIADSLSSGFFVASATHFVKGNDALVDRYNLDSNTFPHGADNMTTIGCLPTRVNRGFNIFATLDPELFNEVIDEITVNNAVSNIIGVYSIPETIFMAMINWAIDSSGNKIMATGMNFDKFMLQVPKSYRVDDGSGDPEFIKNTKLCLSPYSFLRVITPTGDEKEYHYEDFKTVYDEDSWITFADVADTYIEFKFTGAFDATPTVSFVPMEYKMNGVMYGSWNSSYGSYDTYGFTVPEDYKTNYFERIEFNRIPQMPYQTDGYLAFIASAASATMDSHTLIYDTQYDNAMVGSIMNDITNVAGLALGGSLGMRGAELKRDLGNASVVDGLSGGSSGLSGRMRIAQNELGYQMNMSDYALKDASAGSGLVNNILQRDLMRQQMEVMKGAEEINLEDLRSNPFVRNMKNARRSHGKSQYHLGTAGGMEYFNYLSSMDFTVIKVSLRPEILREYDKFFTLYGYNSCRYDRPRIMNFIKGEDDDTLKPVFLRTDESEIIKKYITYVKTSDAEFKAPLKTVEDYFATLFTNGVQFYDGDSILQQERGDE